jgi:hypothetical protein
MDMSLRNAKNLHGFKIHVIDGELGIADQLYFDDEVWTIRYLIVKTGGWLSGRSVLLSPISILDVDWDAEVVNVSLTKEQVKGSPDIDLQRPVSRQHESGYLGYYGYPNYWIGPYLWGPAYAPSDLAGPLAASLGDEKAKSHSGDSHLRSTQAVRGYEIQTNDGELGHVKGFIIDDFTWAIRYIEVSTGYWWPGKNVLVAPAWIKRVSWAASKVYVNLTREVIQSGPEYLEAVPITREYEDRLYLHYAKQSYWADEAESDSYYVLTGR